MNFINTILIHRGAPFEFAPYITKKALTYSCHIMLSHRSWGSMEIGSEGFENYLWKHNVPNML